MVAEATLQKTAEPNGSEWTRARAVYRPTVDIFESVDELTVLADVPGATADNLDINFENGRLTIYAKVEPRQADETRYLFAEYGAGDYRRTFEVSEVIDPAGITAELKHGVLTLHLPKAEPAKPRKIEVKTT